MKYLNRFVYKPRVLGSYQLTTGVPPYRLAITQGAWYTVALEHTTVFRVSLTVGPHLSASITEA